MKRKFIWACLALAALFFVTFFSGFSLERLEAPLPSNIKDKDGNIIMSLDRELRREEVSIEDIPEHVICAFIAIEDVRFYEHPGVDYRAIFRAGVSNFRETGNPFQGSQGGSTITQQLIKNTMLSPERTLSRKVREAWLALRLERKYSKEKILELYLNNATYFNHNNYGIQAASKFYFDKDVNELTLAEGALLAGIIRHPSRFSPHENPEATRQRQETVLLVMKEEGFISENEYLEALSKDLEEQIVPIRTRGFQHPYFVDYVINQEALPILRDKLGSRDLPGNIQDAETLLYFHGLTIHTTMDQELQNFAEEIMNDPANYPASREDESGVFQPQGALVVTEPATGGMRALVGGRDYGIHNMVNRATSYRSPGSALKPIMVFAPAIEERLILPASPIEDLPATWKTLDGEEYSPRNYSGNFSGATTIRRALAHSLNVPAVKVYNDMLNRETGMAYAKEFGISTFEESDKYNPAAALGGLSRGVTPVELNQAYAVLAHGGIKVQQHAITRIEDRNGNLIYEHEPVSRVVVSQETAWLVNDMLKDAVTYGTASSLNFNFPVAAKTGTSQDFRDAWLTAYTPEMVATCWLGHDTDNIALQNRTLYTTRIIQNVLSFALAEIETSDFGKPDGIVGPLEVCIRCGHLASNRTPQAFKNGDYFPVNMTPDRACSFCTSPATDLEEVDEEEIDEGVDVDVDVEEAEEDLEQREAGEKREQEKEEKDQEEKDQKEEDEDKEKEQEGDQEGDNKEQDQQDDDQEEPDQEETEEGREPHLQPSA